jgi:cytochrome b6-f complex iron-sulfur subunit
LEIDAALGGVRMSSGPMMSRRKALNRLWQIGGLMVSGAGGLIGLRFLASRAPDSPFGTVISAGEVKEFPPGTVTPFENARFFLVRAPDGGFLALYHRCTHLDCVIQWREADAQFFCPCHGSQFDQNGAAIKAPAAEPLGCFAIIIDEQRRVKVDTSRLIMRKRISPKDYIYAPGSPE